MRLVYRLGYVLRDAWSGLTRHPGPNLAALVLVGAAVFVLAGALLWPGTWPLPVPESPAPVSVGGDTGADAALQDTLPAVESTPAPSAPETAAGNEPR